jgi:6-pyruvoyl-tetrahydropterin synthase related domain
MKAGNELQPRLHGWRGLLGPAVILVAAFAATSPQLFRGNSCGHDFNFHLVSWLDTVASWRHGSFYPHWAPSPNFGAGEPRFVFYPPLTWIVGALIGLVAPWKGVPLVVTWLLLAGTGLATRMLARQALSDPPATLAGCAAMFSGYALFTAYERSAFGELSGGFWIPLLLLLVFRDGNPAGSVWRRALDGSIAPLALVLAGAWLSNAPLGVMASYLLAAVALTMAVQRRSWAPVLRATVAAGLGLGLAAFYLVPAAMEQKWVEIRQATDDPGLLIENSWLFARHASNPALELHDVELFKASAIGITMIAVALGGLFIAWRRGKLPGKREWWIALALIPVVVFLLQLPISLPVWNVLPKLRFLQFPWRWLVVLEAPMAIFFASAVWMSRRWLRMSLLGVCVVWLLGATLFTTQVFFQFCDYEDSVRGTLRAFRNGSGFEGTDEYAPPGADDSLVALNLPDACLTANPRVVLGTSVDDLTPVYQPVTGQCDATFSWNQNAGRASAEHLHLAAVTPRAGYLVLKLRTYPAWQIKLNGQLMNSLPQREDGLMVVPVPNGAVSLSVDWTNTADVIAGRWLSLVALFLLTCLFLLERGWAEPRLS